jgi:hypothetical protein
VGAIIGAVAGADLMGASEARKNMNAAPPPTSSKSNKMPPITRITVVVVPSDSFSMTCPPIDGVIVSPVEQAGQEARSNSISAKEQKKVRK